MMTATLNARTVQANRAKSRSDRSGTVLFVTAGGPEIVGSFANFYRSPDGAVLLLQLEDFSRLCGRTSRLEPLVIDNEPGSALSRKVGPNPLHEHAHA